MLQATPPPTRMSAGARGHVSGMGSPAAILASLSTSWVHSMTSFCCLVCADSLVPCNPLHGDFGFVLVFNQLCVQVSVRNW